MPERNFDKEAANWDAEPRRVKLARDIVEFIKSEVKLDPGMDIMDFGCGTGLVGVLLRPEARSLVCVDNSRGMLDVLKVKVAIVDIAGVARQFYQALRGGGFVFIADLELEQGKFHEDHTGVFHQGFGRDKLSVIFAEAGFTDIRFRRAAEVEKPSGKFPVFLMVGSKKREIS